MFAWKSNDCDIHDGLSVWVAIDLTASLSHTLFLSHSLSLCLYLSLSLPLSGDLSRPLRYAPQHFALISVAIIDDRAAVRQPALELVLPVVAQQRHRADDEERTVIALVLHEVRDERYGLSVGSGKAAAGRSGARRVIEDEKE